MAKNNEQEKEITSNSDFALMNYIAAVRLIEEAGIRKLAAIATDGNAVILVDGLTIDENNNLIIAKPGDRMKAIINNA